MSEGTKAMLKSLCCSNGWSYAVLWGFNHQNSLLLTLRDSYYEEQMGVLVDDMLLQVHMLGSGVIGQVAFSKKHKWMLSDTNSVWQSFHGLADNCELLQDEDSEFYGQFSCGIKTIAVISVESFGVVQFGSNQKLPERMEFVDETKELFQKIDVETVLPEYSPSSANGENFGNIESLSSSFINAPYFTSPISLPSAEFADFLEGNCPIMNASAWGFEGSSLTSPNLSSGAISGDSDDVLCAMPNHLEYRTNTIQDVLERPIMTSTQELGQFWTFEKSSHANDFVVNTINNDMSCVTSVLSTSSNLNEQTNFNVGSIDPSVSVKSSISNAFNSFPREKYLNSSAYDDKVFDGFGCKMLENLDIITKPMARSGQQWDFGSSKGWPSNRLFSKLGLDQLLNENPSSSCSFVGSSCDDHLSSTKKRRIESPLLGDHTVKPSNLNSFDRNIKLGHPRDGMKITGTDLPTKEHEKPSKPFKKKAKRGTQPIPKDRARTYERLAELRKLIPNGEKMSIDRLLDQTIKQLFFMQSVTRHAEGLKRTEELKDGKGQTNTNSNSNANGVTWACEIENQTMVCPLIVEDLSTPGQMLIEIMCQEQGFFLEIVDVIRGFGLNILKGIMELRETKIWAHFIVEANGFVSRHEIFSSLLQLLQLAGPSELHASGRLGNVRDGRISPVNNCPEFALPFPISLH